jgi:hypothetical protein
MKKNIIIQILLVFISNIILAQKNINLRLSLGNGKPFASKYNSTNTNLPSKVNVLFGHGNPNSTFANRVLNNLQAGVMVEYKNKNNIISVGIVNGRTELMVSTNYVDTTKSLNYFGASMSSATLKKYGIEYTHDFKVNKFTNNKILKGCIISPNIGCFFADHSYVDYNSAKLGFVTKDEFGVTTDSSMNTKTVFNKYGFILSAGIRIGKLNKNNKEKYSITFLYDKGFVKLWQLNDFNYFNYLQDHINTTQYTRGSQFKIYFSKPIGIYNIDKHKKNRK